MLPFKTMLHIDRGSSTPLYVQLANEMIKQINFGRIAPGYKMPGSRKLSDLLGINRRTASLAYEELEAQGWLEIRPNSGTYVRAALPTLQPHSLPIDPTDGLERIPPFEFEDKFDFLDHFEPATMMGDRLIIDAGYPDIRLSPLKSLARHLSSIIAGHHTRRLMNYTTSFRGDRKLIGAIQQLLRDTRSIHVSALQILITRGSLHAFFNLFQILLQPGDHVVVGVPGFHVANKIIRIAGGSLLELPVDEEGLMIDDLPSLCRKKKVKAVFIMPHHHNPTTVSLSAERRMNLIAMAQEHGFVIIEDDYDYDFHYDSSPILPMASSDLTGHVIYVGSLSKTIAPGLRMGFVVAPSKIIKHLSRLSRFIDCHGNGALERAIAIAYEEGEIQRYLRKALKVYHRRRDHFCDLLDQKLADLISYKKPDGGMAVWTTFDERLSIPDLRDQVSKKGLLIPRSVFYDESDHHLNAIRLGFASLERREATRAISILADTARSMIRDN